MFKAPKEEWGNKGLKQHIFIHIQIHIEPKLNDKRAINLIPCPFKIHRFLFSGARRKEKSKIKVNKSNITISGNEISFRKKNILFNPCARGISVHNIHRDLRVWCVSFISDSLCYTYNPIIILWLKLNKKKINFSTKKVRMLNINEHVMKPPAMQQTRRMKISMAQTKNHMNNN